MVCLRKWREGSIGISGCFNYMKNFLKKWLTYFFAILRAVSQFKFLRSFRKDFLSILVKFIWYSTVLVTFWSLLLGKIRNWARWSEMLVIIFPTIILSDGSVEKIFLISVFDLGLIQVGEVIWGMKELENIMSKKFTEWLFSSL